MQAFFARVDLAAYRQQQQQATAKYLTEHPPPRTVTPPPPRAVGRPKKKRLAAEALAAAAEAADLAATQVNKRVRGNAYVVFCADTSISCHQHGCALRVCIVVDV